MIGSRRWAYQGDVLAFVTATLDKYPDATIVSGGARGVDQEAEQHALSLGASVISFRPYKKNEQQWGVKCWRLTRENSYIETLEGAAEMWVDFAGAAWYRNLLIAELADVGAAFWDGLSKGTKSTIDAFAAEGKDCHVYTPNRRFS